MAVLLLPLEAMRLFLMRHGIAERLSGSGRDADRRLTIDGIAGVRRVVKQARLKGLEPSVILASPYRRAVETAEVAARLLGLSSGAEGNGIIQQSHAFTPDSSPEDLWDELRVNGNEPCVLLAAHEPLVSRTTSWMLGSSRPMIQFEPAMMVEIELERAGPEPRGLLRGVFRP